MKLTFLAYLYALDTISGSLMYITLFNPQNHPRGKVLFLHFTDEELGAQRPVQGLTAGK